MHYQWLNDIVFDFVIEIQRLVLLLILDRLSSNYGIPVLKCMIVVACSAKG